MSLVLSLELKGAEGLTTSIRDVVRQASSHPGMVVEVERGVAEQLCDELTAKTAAELWEVRRRERSLPPQVLGFQFG